METTELYQGAVKLCFDARKHVYTVDGQVVDGVTSALGVIAKPALVPWAVKMTLERVGRHLKPGVALDEIQINRAMEEGRRAHREKTSDAAAIGTMVHAYAETALGGGEPTLPVNTEAANAVSAFDAWRVEHDVRPLMVERKVYSRRHNYAGTVDLVANVAGRLTVIDLKSSSGLYNEMRYQVSAYRNALEEEGIIKPGAARAVVRFDKRDGSFEYHPLPDEDHDGDLRAFLSALEVHRRQKFHDFRNKTNRAA